MLDIADSKPRAACRAPGAHHATLSQEYQDIALLLQLEVDFSGEGESNREVERRLAMQYYLIDSVG